MSSELPHPKQVWEAIETYLRCAYDGAKPPAAVQNRLESLRAAGEDGGFFASGVFERDSSPVPKKYSLRLGNRFYPHMKLSIDQRPDQGGFLFRADTHDRHICPAPASKEYSGFCELMEKNQKVAQSIEAAWGEGGLPTFKTFLKQDLARRQQSDPKP
ncbi:MAG TPA: hypothetical protein VGP94_05395 [Tepidisphaeraceae bacterium]|nr:hypothetical protein [Tepidisphaeraceae bacterium]